VERLVVEGLHAYPCAYAASDSCQRQQRRFRDSPPVVLRFPFVDAESCERGYIYYNKVGDNQVGN
jgi:hypothetical protein